MSALSGPSAVRNIKAVQLGDKIKVSWTAPEYLSDGITGYNVLVALY